LNSSVPKRIILIGASTGGPGEIQKIVESLPKLKNETLLIAQHMMEGFMNSFSSRLQNSSENLISIAQDKELLKSGHIYVVEGQTKVQLSQNSLLFSKESSSKNSFNPSINILFDSLTPLSQNIEILCVILTGIGDDGVQACKNLSLNGARCLTQNEQSAIVDGMPNRARTLVQNIEVYDTPTIIKTIKEFVEYV